MAATVGATNFTSLSYNIESVYGEAPITQAFHPLKFTGESFAYGKTTINSNNINSTRQVTDSILTGFDVTGGFNIELSTRMYDELISGAMWSNWGTNIDETITSADITVVAATGTFTITTGTHFANIIVGQFIQFTGFTNAGNNGIFQVKTVTSNKEIILEDAYWAELVDETSSADVSLQASIIRNGVVRKSFFFEKIHTDLTPYQYMAYHGELVNTFSISAQSSAILTGTFDFVGKTSTIYNDDAENSSTNPYGAGNGTALTASKSTYTDAATVATFSTELAYETIETVTNIDDVRIGSVGHVGASVLEADNSTGGTFIQGIDLSVNNNLRGVKALGIMGNAGVSPGQFLVEGTINALFDDDTMYRKFLSGDDFSLWFSFTDANGEAFSFFLPKVTVTTDSMNAGGNDQDLVENLNFTALMYHDTTEDIKYTLQIDRLYNDYTGM